MLALVVLVPGQGRAHPLEPGYLELHPLGGSDWRITWRRPEVQGSPMAMDAVLPRGCHPRQGPEPVFDGRAFATTWLASCEHGLSGGTILIDGLENTQTDVLVRYTHQPGGAPQVRRLTGDVPAFVVPAPQGAGAVFASYLRYGIDHILHGTDHLLFVFALVLLIRRPRQLVIAITAFTIAHSFSLGMATLGWIAVPAPPVEAVVALSIVMLAAELARPAAQRQQWTERFAWVVPFGFGFLHGLAFADALLEMGLPQGDVPLALFAFNLGVEAGQLLFIGGVLAAGFLLGRLGRGAVTAHEHRLRLATAYAIGTLASFWMFERIERIVQFWA